jgi:hypothetical protein
MTSAKENEKSRKAFQLPKNGPLRQLHVLRSIERNWSGALSIYDRAVLTRVVDVTVGWEHPSFSISVSCLLSGKSGDGRVIVGPVGMSLARGKKSLAKLKALGLIKTVGKPTGTIFWADCEKIVSGGQKELQRLRGAANSREMSTNDQTEVSEVPDASASPEPTAVTQKPGRDLEWPHREKNSYQKSSLKEEFQNSAFGGRASPDGLPDYSLENCVSDKKAQKPQIDLKAKAIEELNGPAANFSAHRFAEFWTACLPEGSPHLIWGAKERGQATALRRKWGNNPEHFGDFIVWTLTNWDHLRSYHFRWMKNTPPPVFPDIGFCLNFVTYIVDAYMNRDAGKTANELRLSFYERQLAKGVPIDEIVSNAKKSAVEQERAQAAKIAPYRQHPTKLLQTLAARELRPDEPSEIRPANEISGIKTPPHSPEEYDEEGYLIYHPRKRVPMEYEE